MLFAYVYGKKINSKKNFLRLSIILTVIIYILKANTTSAFLVLISFLEGIFIKMYEISINKEFYALSKKYKYNNYNFVYEFILTSMRLCTMFILLFVNDFKLMIYITLFIIFIGFFIEFKTPKNNYYKKLKNSLF